jgi:ParB-like chromosome segregation protein Spo0J
MLHPIHRARAWRRRLGSERGLNQLKLATEEDLSPGSITHHLKLLQLADEIQAKLLGSMRAAASCSPMAQPCTPGRWCMATP